MTIEEAKKAAYECGRKMAKAGGSRFASAAAEVVRLAHKFDTAGVIEIVDSFGDGYKDAELENLKCHKCDAPAVATCSHITRRGRVLTICRRPMCAEHRYHIEETGADWCDEHSQAYKQENPPAQLKF